MRLRGLNKIIDNSLRFGYNEKDQRKTERIIVERRESLSIDARSENLEKVLSFVDGILEAEDCNMKVMMQLDVAVEEIFINIASYAYGENDGKAEIILTITDDPKAVVIEFRDSGVRFDPLAKPDPDVTLSAEDRQIGGLGIYMVKKSMDDVTYKYENGENILTISRLL